MHNTLHYPDFICIIYLDEGHNAAIFVFFSDA